MIKPIFDPKQKKRSMRVAAFMSGTGTNVQKLIEYQQQLIKRQGKSPFEVILIFSDRSDGTCMGEKIAYKYTIPYFSYDIKAFYRKHGIKFSIATKEGMNLRKRFDETVKKIIKAFDIDIVALGGYMSYTTIKRCVNVHPADLSIKTQDGRRKYRGISAIRDAILAGEQFLRSSTILTDEGIDTGPILMVSKPIPVKVHIPFKELKKDEILIEQVVQEHQERLKKQGDWYIFPRTIELIARGLFSLDEQNRVYFKGEYIPDGYRE